VLQFPAACSDCATAPCPIRAECETLSAPFSPLISPQDILTARLGYLRRRCRSLETQLSSVMNAYWTKITEAA